MSFIEKDNQKRGLGGKLFNFRPALFFALFFALGIMCVYRFKTDGQFVWTMVFSLALIPLSLWLSKKKSFLIGILLLVFFALGVCSAFSQIEKYDNPYAVGTYETTGKIVDVNENGNYVVATIDNLTIDGEKTDGVLIAYFEKEEGDKIRIGDKIILRAELQPYETDKDAFSYGNVADGVRFITFTIEEFAPIHEKPDLFTSLRLCLKERLYSGMSSESAAFTCAVLTGDTRGIEEGLLDNVRFGGVAHIFAVSGLHIGALYAFFRILTDKTRLQKLPRVWKFLFVAVLLLFYGGICRYTTSVVRAITMCLTSYAMRLIGVKSDALERIGVAMLLCLAISPASLFTAGFLLSFGACFGICVLYRTLYDGLLRSFTNLFKEDLGKSLCGFFSAMISAQVFTAPLSLYFFDYLSVWGLLLNCVFVPLLTLSFSVLLAVGWISCLLPITWAGAVLSIPSTVISGLLLLFHAVDFWTLFKGVKVPMTAFVNYYTALAIFSDKTNIKSRIKKIAVALLFIVFVGGIMWINL